MADKAVLDVVEALLDGFNLCLVLGVNRQGQAPAGGDDHVILQQPVANRQRIAQNQPFYLEEGVIRFVVKTAIGEGDDRAQAIHAALVPLFQDVKVGRVRFWTPGPLTPDEDASDGNFYVASFPCPYTFTSHG